MTDQDKTPRTEQDFLNLLEWDEERIEEERKVAVSRGVHFLNHLRDRYEPILMKKELEAQRANAPRPLAEVLRNIEATLNSKIGGFQGGAVLYKTNAGHFVFVLQDGQVLVFNPGDADEWPILVDKALDRTAD